MSWRDHLTDEQIQKIDDRAALALSLTRHGPSDKTPSEQLKTIQRVERLAGELRLLLANIDARSEDSIESAAYTELGFRGMDLTQQTHELLRLLRLAAHHAASEIETKAGAQPKIWKQNLASEVLEIVRSAGMDTSGYNHNDAAEALRYAFHRAGMTSTDVRKYL
ncbi:MAG: hypothetical protein RIE06_27535 [Roseibium album]|uniref:hypothetical protein n=1 Tax=Roseibium album TaxID=311410 RepID=UPI0032EB7191